MEEQAIEILERDKTLTTSEKINFSLKEISRAIKKQLKKEFPECKFSVKTEYYSMGQSLHISILETSFKIVKSFSELSKKAIFEYTRENRTEQELKEMQEIGYYQVGRINQDDIYNPDVWNNGVFLTEKGFNLIKRITELTDKFNWDNSDTQTDYFDVKFYLHLIIGEYNKPLIQREE